MQSFASRCLALQQRRSLRLQCHHNTCPDASSFADACSCADACPWANSSLYLLGQCLCQSCSLPLKVGALWLQQCLLQRGFNMESRWVRKYPGAGPWTCADASAHAYSYAHPNVNFHIHYLGDDDHSAFD